MSRLGPMTDIAPEIRQRNAMRRVHAALDRALSDYHSLAAPDGKVSVDIDDLLTVFMLLSETIDRG